MEVTNIQVKVKGEVIGEVPVEQFASIDEAVTKLSDARVLRMINRQRKTDLTNKVRVQHSNETPAKQISRLARQVQRNEISGEEAAARIKELSAQIA